MNRIIEDKLCSLTNTPNTEDLAFLDFRIINDEYRIKDINFIGIRGSIRLSSLRILLPGDVKLAKKSVLKYSFK